MEEGIYPAVVQRIKDLCKAHNITPNGLSYRAGISQATVKSILLGESKNPGIVTIKKICDGFEISVIDFFNDDLFKNLDQEIK